VDDLQRTYQIDRYNELAKSGPVRGETLYFYKCWACHNALAQDTGPHLKGIFGRPRLMSGEPITEETVVAKIKNGGPRMPGFEHSLTDADMADLISYLRSETCCYEALEPPANPEYRAEARPWPVSSGLQGGVRGVVRSDNGQLLEGIKVQLIAPSGVRTTVFTNDEGRYEFPMMQTGSYTLRIATPVPYKAYRRDGVRVDGANTLEEIVLEEVSEAGGEGDLPGALPASLEIQSQLSGAEMLWNLPGTAQEKALFARACGVGCHEYHQIFRNRFDEHGWRAVIDRMLRYGGNSLIPRREGFGFATRNEVETVVRWLAKVRGPDSKDLPLRVFPRVSGSSTRVVITEYELPRRLLSIHDVYGDSKGNMWYTSHRTPYAGVLDPRTGIVKEYKMPPTPGSLPGTHHVAVDEKNGFAWFSENWARRYARLDMTTSQIKTFSPENIGGGNFGLAPDGFIWTSRAGKEIIRMEPRTGEIVGVYPLTKNPTPYQNAVSFDGRFWAGGSRPTTGANTGMILDIRTGTMYETNSGDRLHSAARGGFEPNGHNAWFGGRDGMLVQIVNEIDQNKGIRIRTYQPPTPYYPYTMFYTAMPDKNGEVWAGVLQGRGFVRYNSRTEQWTVYENPEPSALSRYIWIDNTATPVRVWYADFHTGLIVRIQPLD
jgi:streptogramin lyase